MFGIDWVQTFHNIPPEIATILIATTPIAELRVALPIALAVYKFTIIKAIFLSVLGNMIPTAFLLWLLEPLSQILSKRYKFFTLFFQWLFARTRKKFYRTHEKWGDIGLIIFVGIPLPFTGAWSGAIAAFLFGIPYKKALTLITLGVIIAAIIVSIITKGLFFIF